MKTQENPGIEELKNQLLYKLEIVLKHDEILFFVLEWLKKKSWFILLFFTLNVVFAAAWIFNTALVILWGNSGIGFQTLIFVTACLFFFAFLIPVHETIHLLSMKLLGAQNTFLKPNLKHFMVYAGSHLHVCNSKQYLFIALLPFFILTFLLGILPFFLNSEIWPAIWFLLFLHTNGCAGDLAIVNYFYFNRDKTIYSYDNQDLKESYFFSKR